MQFIVQRTIELSGSTHAAELSAFFSSSQQDQPDPLAAFEARLNETGSLQAEELSQLVANQVQQQEQVSMLRESMDAIMGHLGIPKDISGSEQPENQVSPQ